MGELAFTWAVIADKFHLSPAAVASLTDAQIEAVLFHERDSDGGLVAPKQPKPKGPPKNSDRLNGIYELEAMRLITAERAQELRDEVNRNG